MVAHVVRVSTDLPGGVTTKVSRFPAPGTNREVSPPLTEPPPPCISRVLGMYDGRLLEYDASTLAPLGLVVRRSRNLKTDLPP
jgi:hypothetical protein